MSRRKRPDRLGRLMAPYPRLVAGLLILPAFLLQPDPRYKALLALVFAGLSLFSGKKLQPLYFLMMVTSITFFNLLVPWGRVLFRVGPLTITEGALTRGLLKSFTLIGLVFLSLFTVRKELRLPGRLGGLVTRVFYYLDRIFEVRGRLDPRNVTASLDTLLLSVYDPGGRAPEPDRETDRHTPGGTLLLVLLVAGSWALLIPGGWTG